MIPADVASRLRLVLPDQPAPPQAATPVQKLADVLGDLVPGQRLMAEIQALLPNGTYRAVVAQRDITLALPFAAKPGDSLELEVVDSDGKLTLAVVANRGGAQPPASESVATSLSQTGRLIGDLLGDIDAQGKRAAPAPLNGNQPLVAAFPDNPEELVPLLKEALTRSGMFYESHQARWADGKLPTEALLQEPQGKLSPAAIQAHGQAAEEASATAPKAADGRPLQPPASPPASTPAPDSATLGRNPAATVIPPDLTPLVQQQLDALATQNFVWQGQVWPGQTMEWAIEESPGRDRSEEGSNEQWRTSLRLTLPNLGTVNATLQLRSSSELELALTADSDTARQQLSTAVPALDKRLGDSGLRLTAFRVGDEHGTE